MSVLIRYKKLRAGFKSPYLAIHHCGIRRYEYIGIKIKEKPKAGAERDKAKEQEEFVKRIANKRESEIQTHQYQLEPIRNTAVDFFVFFQEYIDNCPNKDIRAFKAVLSRLKSFTKKNALFCYEINELLLQKFVNHLQASLNGVTPINYTKKLRQVINAAIKQKYIIGNPFSDVIIKPRTSKVKAALTSDELHILFGKPCPNLNVKRAFLLSCLTGLRFCDLKDMRWKDVINDIIDVNQKKTGVYLPIHLNEEAKKLLQHRKGEEDLVFKLPSHTACLKNLKSWMKNAEIKRHITFHSGRYSFAISLLNSGVDIYTISKLLGHTSVKYTSVYLRGDDRLAKDALSKLPKIF